MHRSIHVNRCRPAAVVRTPDGASLPFWVDRPAMPTMLGLFCHEAAKRACHLGGCRRKELTKNAAGLRPGWDATRRDTNTKHVLRAGGLRPFLFNSEKFRLAC